MCYGDGGSREDAPGDGFQQNRECGAEDFVLTVEGVEQDRRAIRGSAIQDGDTFYE
jgi:hypothetical protein